jgi:hypothetical protein
MFREGNTSGDDSTATSSETTKAAASEKKVDKEDAHASF